MDEEVNPVKMPLLKYIRLMVSYNTWSTIWWLRHAAAVHILRYVFCPQCSGYFTRAIMIGSGPHAELLCEACYVRTFGRGI